MNAAQWNLLRRRWNRALGMRAALSGAGMGCLVGSCLWIGFELLGKRGSWPLVVAAVTGAAAAAVYAASRRPLRVSTVDLIRHLDRTFPQFEESSRLWVLDEATLSPVEKLQRRRINAAWLHALEAAERGAPSPMKPPGGFLRGSAWALVAGASLALLARSIQLPVPRNEEALAKASEPVKASAPSAAAGGAKAVPVTLGSAVLTVVPPAYTGLRPRRVEGLDAAVEEGSVVRWEIAFTGTPASARVEFGEGQAAPLALSAAAAGVFSGEQVQVATQLYRLSVLLSDGSRRELPELHALKVIADAPPTVEVVTPSAARTVIDPSTAGAWKVEVRVKAADDYGLGAAKLVATVAKGSGEGVKFREQSFPFEDSDLGREHTFIQTLDLKALGMEPGDELYFHAAVSDRKAPHANVAVSETRFVALKGPESSRAATARGLGGVNLVPEYFRSERQLIIDTERLVADQPTLSQAEFQRRAEDLGFDQSLLKDRYGQFMGAETEDDSEGPADEAQKKKPAAAQRDSQGPRSSDQVIAPYVDQHDAPEAETLFDSRQKGSLREVIAAMWEAERYLRTLRPAEALPAENHALRVLKVLQQGSRVYVKHVGFDAAPLAVAERRLRADLGDIPVSGSFKEATVAESGSIAGVRDVLKDLDWSRPGVPLTEEQRGMLRRAEAALLRAATADPDRYLEALGDLRRALAEGSLSARACSELPKALLRLVPPTEPHPAARDEASPKLASAYLKALLEVQP